MTSSLKSDSHNQVYRGNVLSQVESDIYNQIEMTEPPESDIHNRIEITESIGRIKMTELLKSDGHSRVGLTSLLETRLSSSSQTASVGPSSSSCLTDV